MSEIDTGIAKPVPAVAVSDPALAQHRLAALDGMRAVAAVGVVVVHVSIYTGNIAAGFNHRMHSGWVGYVTQPISVAVPFFCVMAGMLLYRQFTGTALHGKPMPSVGAYLWRRALRVLPLYWLVVIVALLAVNHDVGVWGWIRGLSFLTIYHRNKYGSADLPSGLVPTWSLASEAVFYLLLPVMAAVLAWAATRFGRDLAARARITLALLVPVLGFQLAWVAIVHGRSFGQWPMQWYWLPNLIGYFGAGMMLAVLLDWARDAPERPPALYRLAQGRPYLLWLIALTCFVALGFPQLLGHDANTFYPGVRQGVDQYLLHLVCATCLVLAIVAGKRNRLLTAPVLVLGGQLSYGIYIWHEVVLEIYFKARGFRPGDGDPATTLPIVLGGAIVLAWLSYTVVEKPVRRTLRPLLGKAAA
ncbi:acyltransferase [Nocardia sp. CDC153]|uniref:acyltransferase family protein n=1 Tax=Nocardia sp. CDC153 TaxID=3112167 RepID=UPI002DB8524B|nr:acyltransferase [Nocardia sp. CDC153]MEC3952014.1 acyltransferase [Nocardia sp. CDC153]